MRYLRGDLSAPVLAILVTIGIIAAGLILLAWFWWIAPQAGKVGTLQILGTPSIDTEGRLYISVRNIGNEKIQVTEIYVENVKCTFNAEAVNAGESKTLIAECRGVTNLEEKRTVSGIIVTDYGTYSFTAAVIR